MIDTSTTPDDINKFFQQGVVTHYLPSGKPYMRTVGGFDKYITGLDNMKTCMEELHVKGSKEEPEN